MQNQIQYSQLIPVAIFFGTLFFFFFYLYKFILMNEFCACMHVIDKKTSDGVDAC
jgi:hypothetical protein